MNVEISRSTQVKGQGALARTWFYIAAPLQHGPYTSGFHTHLVVEIVAVLGHKELYVPHDHQHIQPLESGGREGGGREGGREGRRVKKQETPPDVLTRSVSPPPHPPYLLQGGTGEVWLEHVNAILLLRQVSHVAVRPPVVEGDCRQVIECHIQVVGHVGYGAMWVEGGRK